MRDFVSEELELARDLKVAPHPAPASSDVVRVLEAGRKLIERPECLARGCSGDGKNTFCTVAAVNRAAKADDGYKLTRHFFRRAVPKGFNRTFVEYSDTAPHEDVLAMWDRAISLARSEGEGK